MHYRFLLIITISLLTRCVYAQIYFTKEASISFHSSTPFEEIKAINKKAVSIIDLEKSVVEFSVLIKGFRFKNALMQTHFNENYMESDTYPKAVFKSTSAQLANIAPDTDGMYTVKLSGILTIREEKKEIETEAIFLVQQGKISATATFIVSPGDFNIIIPEIVREKIAKEIEVSVEANYQTYEKS